MSLSRFGARNHPQQVRKRGANPLVDNRETDPELFAELHARYAFTLDVAALPSNAKLPRYFTPETDGLAQSWAGERVWCNPPFSNIEPWVRKAWREADLAKGIVMLLPANRTEQGWWQDLVEPNRDRPGTELRTAFLRGRRRFIAPGADTIGPNERPPFGVVLLAWGVVLP